MSPAAACAGAATQHQGSEWGTPPDSWALLNHDVEWLIWERSSIRDLAKMSAVCKGWRQSISDYNAAKRARLGALIQAPNSLPDDRLGRLQLVFRCLKRHLLLQDALTGGELDSDAILRWGCSDVPEGFVPWSSLKHVAPLHPDGSVRDFKTADRWLAAISPLKAGDIEDWMAAEISDLLCLQYIGTKEDQDKGGRRCVVSRISITGYPRSSDRKGGVGFFDITLEVGKVPGSPDSCCG